MRSFWSLFDDRKWVGIDGINSHAIVMGYISMAIKGLGYLVLTWTTVVLLGGFVSMLHKKDFWCLTFITFVQTAGIIDVNLNEKLGYVENAIFGMLGSIYWGVVTVDLRTALYAVWAAEFRTLLLFFAQLLLASILLVVQIVMMAAILCPLAIIYVLGILISGGISLWRLIEHDYEGNSDVETSNLAPAMDTLYYLALLQGVLFCYRFILRCTGKKFIRRSSTINYDDSELKMVTDYLHETRRGCEKDPSFAKGRNLITAAIGKIISSSPAECISGVKMLYIAMCIADEENSSESTGDMFTGQHVLMKHMITSASSSGHVLQKLLETLDSKGLHDRETRSKAAKIVEHLAYNINLMRFPEGIEHVSSMVGTFEQYCIAEPYQRDGQYWDFPTDISCDAMCKLRMAYKDLLLQGMSILRKLATNEINCRVMSDTQGLVSKIMAPISSDLLHHTTNDHDDWSDVVQGSMEVMIQLTGSPGESGAKLRREISSCKDTINTLQRIISCTRCNEKLHECSIWILTSIYIDITESSKSANFTVVRQKSSNHNSREEFVRRMVETFIGDKYSSSIRIYAGKALSAICFHGGISDATVVMQTSGYVVDNLTQVLLYDENETCRQAAAKILEQLCTHYTKNDEYFVKLNKAAIEVIGKILCHGDKDKFANPKTDIENQFDGTKENNEQDKKEQEVQTIDISVMSVDLLSALISLIGAVYNTTFINDLAPQFDSSSFLNKLKEVVAKEGDRFTYTVDNLLLFKAITRMVISMTIHNGGRFVKQEDDLRSLIEALSSASKNIVDLDNSMVFRSTSRFKTTSWSKLGGGTLSSLVKEAKELYA